MAFYFALKTASNSQKNNNGLVYGRVSILGTLDNEKCWHVLVTDRAEFGAVLRANRYGTSCTRDTKTIVQHEPANFVLKSEYRAVLPFDCWATVLTFESEIHN